MAYEVVQQNGAICCAGQVASWLSRPPKLDEEDPLCNNGSKGMLREGVSTLVTQTIARRRRPKGIHPKRIDRELPTQKLPEYLEADEVGAIIRAAEDSRARLLMLEQWRAGLRVSEALALEVSDLSLDTENPTLRVRSGKGRRARMVPVHPGTGGRLQDGTVLQETLAKAG